MIREWVTRVYHECLARLSFTSVSGGPWGMNAQLYPKERGNCVVQRV